MWLKIILSLILISESLLFCLQIYLIRKGSIKLFVGALYLLSHLALIIGTISYVFELHLYSLTTAFLLHYLGYFVITLVLFFRKGSDVSKAELLKIFFVFIVALGFHLFSLQKYVAFLYFFWFALIFLLSKDKKERDEFM